MTKRSLALREDWARQHPEDLPMAGIANRYWRGPPLR